MRLILLSSRAFISLTIGILIGSIFATGALAGGLRSSNITQMLADLERPYIYALSNNPAGPDSLLIIEVESEAIIARLPVTSNPTDLDISYYEARLFVIGFDDNEIDVFDLTTLTYLHTLEFPQPTNWGTNLHYNLVTGRLGRLYYTDANWSPKVHVLNTSTGAHLGSFSFDGIGDLAISPDKNRLYTWRQYGWSAGSSSSWLNKINCSSDNLTLLQFSNTAMDRDPLDTPLLVSGNGYRLACKEFTFTSENINQFESQFPDDIYGMTLDGSVLFTSSQAFDTEIGGAIYDFPFTTKVQAVSGNQEKLFLYNASESSLSVVPMEEVGMIPVPDGNPFPADQATALSPLETLSWGIVPSAISYQVFVGTDSMAVVEADLSSPEYLGQVETNFIDLDQPFVQGETYFWRVDKVGYSQTTPGRVWSFTIATVTITPNSLDLTCVTGMAPFQVELDMMGEDPLNGWSISEDIPWLEVDSGAGNPLPATLVVTVNPASLEPGIYGGLLHFIWGEGAFDLPVEMDLAAVTPRKMLADQERPYIYAIDTGGGGFNDARLHFLSTESGLIVKTIPIGSNPTDLAINYGEGKLYVSNWLRENTHVVDLESQEELAPLVMGNDVFKLNAGRPGRLYYEEEGQWISIHIINTQNGQNLGSWEVREGDGEIDPTGNWYYHCDNNSTEASIQKYDISTDNPVEVAESLVHSYGSGKLVMSPDGSRLFWQGGYIYDAELNELGNLNSEIYTTTLHGDLAFASDEVFNTHTGDVIYTLPVSSTVMAVAGDQESYFYYDEMAGRIEFIPMTDIADIPGPGLNPSPADRSNIILPMDTLAWDLDPTAMSYQVYFGTDSTAVATADLNAPEFLGQVTENSIELDVNLQFEETYYWRLDTVGFSETITGSVWSFTVVPVIIDPKALDLTVFVGNNTAQAQLRLEINGPFDALTFKENIPWLSIDQFIHPTTPDVLFLTLDVEGLASGQYTGVIHFTWDTYLFDVPIELELLDMVLTKLLADQERPWIYGLHPGSGQSEDALLLFINTETDNIDKIIPIGSNPTDLTINYGEGKLYVSNWTGQSTRIVDLATQEELASMPLGSDVFKLNAGRPGRLYYEEEDQWVYIHIINSYTGQELGSWFVREGDGEVDPSGNWYYHCDNNSSGATIQKYDISTDNPVEVAESQVHGYGSRNLIMSPDGSRLFWKGGYIYDADLNELGYLNSEIYATTLHGDLAMSSSSVFNTHTGDVIYNLPSSSSVMAVSGDQEKLFIFVGGVLDVIAMDEIADIPGPGLNPIPTDRSTVLLPVDALSWDIDPVAMSYRVFFGADSTAVAAADLESPLFLGEINENEMDLEIPLELGATYYWRLDLVGFTGIIPGPVWSFTIFPHSVDPSVLDLTMVTGLTSFTESLEMAAESMPDAADWTISENASWIELDITSGGGPATVVATFLLDGLDPGVHEVEIELVSGDYEVMLPVKLELFLMEISKLQADLERPWIYGLHRGSGSFDDAFLLFINTETETVEKVIPIGSNPTDLTINYVEGKLYVSNWSRQNTRVVDLESQEELAPLEIGNDVFKLNAGRLDRLYYEEQDQWVNIHIINTQNGQDLGSWHVREGDGEVAPSGNWYYHCDNNSSGATIQKYDISTDNPVQVAESLVHGYGSRNLVMSPDGSRLFWKGGYIYDADLNELGDLNNEIYATTLHGDLAFSSSQVFNVHTGNEIYNLPIETSLIAVSGDQSKVFLFNESLGNLQVVSMSDIADVPAPGLNPIPADRSTMLSPVDLLSWEIDPSAIGYEVFFGADSTAVATADLDSPLYLGSVIENNIELNTSLELGITYFWRLDTVGLNETTIGEVWSFTIFPMQVSPGVLNISVATSMDGYSLTILMGPEAMPGVTEWTVSEDIPWVNLDAESGQVNSLLGIDFVFDDLPNGVHTGVMNMSAGGIQYDFQVSLEVFTMQLSQMAVDHQRSQVFGLHPGSGVSNDAFLVVYSMISEKVEKAIPIGINPTDMALNYHEDRLYVTNWQNNLTRVVDLASFSELQPLELGPDVYRINALGSGRIICEEEDQWVYTRIFETSNGEILGFNLLREGDAESDPTGQYYYHCDNNTSNARLHKYNTASNNLEEVATSPPHPYGSRNLVISGDGSRLFWRGYVYDADLNELGNLGSEVQWASEDGRWAVCGRNIYDVDVMNQVTQLPFTPTTLASNLDFDMVYAFNPGSGFIEAISTTLVSNALSNFQAERDGRRVRLVWEVAELDTDTQFEVLRQADGQNMESVNAAVSQNGQVFLLVDPEATSQSCNYWLNITPKSGNSFLYGPVKVAEVPAVFDLGKNYPNPFNPETTIEFTTMTPGLVMLRVFDLRGHLVATLVNEKLSAGWHEVVWRGKDDHGRSAHSGVYLVQLQSTQGFRSKKIMLMK